VNALVSNTTGNDNTASGLDSLRRNTTGNFNTAYGSGTLAYNTTGSNNTAVGEVALIIDYSGSNNVAVGAEALSNSDASGNTAVGYGALYLNTTGSGNTASGENALYADTTGFNNTAFGSGALQANTIGTVNLALGQNALFSNTLGSNNVAIGAGAGYAITGSHNIDIGSPGSAGENGVVRIGGPSQTAVYLAGITSVPLTGSAVYVSADGQLGVLASSERYKTEITSMGGRTEKLHALRPVSFHLKSDPNGAVQYGLIAEEVAKVYPELVIHDNAGTIQGVRYDELAPLLLNEVQHQAAEISRLKRQVRELSSLKHELRSALHQLKPADESIPALR